MVEAEIAMMWPQAKDARATRSWKGQQGFSPGASSGSAASRHLDWTSASKPGENEFVLFEGPCLWSFAQHPSTPSRVWGREGKQLQSVLSAGFHRQQVALSSTGELRESEHMLLKVMLPQGQGPWVFIGLFYQCWCPDICGPQKPSDEEMQGLEVGVGWGALSSPTAGRGLVSDGCRAPLPGPQLGVGILSLHPFCITSV